jgi:hypothetical protein
MWAAESLAFRYPVAFAVTLTPADQFLPKWDIAETEEVAVGASAVATYRALRSANMGRSLVIRTLFRLRGMPESALTWDGLARLRFITLSEKAPEHLVLGIIGKFWTVTGNLQRFEPGKFASFSNPEFAKAVWSLSLDSGAGGVTRLSTETRVHCPDPQARKRFKRYWVLVGPFSRWIRRELLRIVKESAESGPDNDPL